MFTRILSAVAVPLALSGAVYGANGAYVNGVETGCGRQRNSTLGDGRHSQHRV